ncbi:MAG: ATP-binding protein [bacterium]|nr:ATP-binding protein [bacterium]
MLNKTSLLQNYSLTFRAEEDNVSTPRQTVDYNIQRSIPDADKFNKMVEEQQKAIKKEEKRRKLSLGASIALTCMFALSTGLMIWQALKGHGSATKLVFKKCEGNIPDYTDDCVNLKVRDAIEYKLKLKGKSKAVLEHIGKKDKATFYVFHGDPGTGKTLSGKIFAKALDARCVERQFADYSSIYVGETAVNITKDYKLIKKICDENPKEEFVYIVNECDALFNNVERLGANNEHLGQNRTAQINGLDIVKDCPNLTIIFTTNVNPKSAKLDPALLSRLNVVEIGHPNEKEQLACLKYTLKQYPIAKILLNDENALKKIAKQLCDKQGTQRDTANIVDSAINKFGANVNDTKAQITADLIEKEIAEKETWAASIGKDDLGNVFGEDFNYGNLTSIINMLLKLLNRK